MITQSVDGLGAKLGRLPVRLCVRRLRGCESWRFRGTGREWLFRTGSPMWGTRFRVV